MATAPRPSAYPLASGERKPQQQNNAIISLQRGQLAYTGSVTVPVGKTEITVFSPIAGVGQKPYLSAQSSAAALTPAWAPPVSVPGQFTIFLTAPAPANCTYSWLCAG